MSVAKIALSLRPLQFFFQLCVRREQNKAHCPMTQFQLKQSLQHPAGIIETTAFRSAVCHSLFHSSAISRNYDARSFLSPHPTWHSIYKRFLCWLWWVDGQDELGL